MREFVLPGDSVRDLSNEELLELVLRVSEDCRTLAKLHPTTAVKITWENHSDFPRVMWAGDVRGHFKGTAANLINTMVMRDRKEKMQFRAIAMELMGED